MATSANSSSLFTIITMLLLGVIMLGSLHCTDAQIGMVYGTSGDNLPSPSEVVSLYQEYFIFLMRVNQPNQSILQALSGSKIGVMLGVPNNNLSSIASSQANANLWVQTNIKAYPNVNFTHIVVGNQVSPLSTTTSSLVSYIVPAMRNLKAALSAAGLGSNQIAVSTTINAVEALNNLLFPLTGSFKSQMVGYVSSIVQYCSSNGAPILLNISPYTALTNYSNSQVSLDFALFKPTAKLFGYSNLFDMIIDSTYTALSLVGGGTVNIVVSETGWPTSGGQYATVANAQTYITNLVKAVLSGGGSLIRPRKSMPVYMRSVFDENLLSPEVEKHYGVFYPNTQPKYEVCY